MSRLHLDVFPGAHTVRVDIATEFHPGMDREACQMARVRVARVLMELVDDSLADAVEINGYEAIEVEPTPGESIEDLTDRVMVALEGSGYLACDHPDVSS